MIGPDFRRFKTNREKAAALERQFNLTTTNASPNQAHNFQGPCTSRRRPIGRKSLQKGRQFLSPSLLRSMPPDPFDLDPHAQSEHA